MTSGPQGDPVVADPPPPRLLACLAIVAGYWAVCAGATWGMGHAAAAGWTGNGIFQAVVVVVVAAIAAQLWVLRRWLMRTVTSIPFSAAVLTALMVWTAIGTVILQQASPADYAERHGRILAAAMLTIGMDDIFHTPWFNALMALVAVSLVLTAIRKRAWRLPMWGHLLSHMGFVVVLAGGWIGGIYGWKGVIDLHEGEIANEVHVTGRGGVPGPARPLGFGIKLEKFAVENYKPEAKFYIYERSGEDFRIARVFDCTQALKPRPAGSRGGTFRLVKAYPDFAMQPEIADVPAGTGGPVLAIGFRQDAWAATAALEPVTGRDTTRLSADGPEARFVWAAPSADELARLAQPVPEQHVIMLASAGGVDEAALPVGGEATLAKGGFTVRALEYLPDFSYDGTTKTATSRSNLPNNPALRVSIRNTATGEQSTRWLFAKMPDFGHGDGAQQGPRFAYRREPARAPATRSLLVVGEAAQIWTLESGQVRERLPLDQWQTVCAGLPVAAMRLHPSAVIRPVATSRSETWNKPVADIVLNDGGEQKELRLTTDHTQPIALSDGKSFLSFELRSDEPKSFRSHLTVVVGGKTAAEKTIVVNDPLMYDGIMFYQSNYRKSDPTYSGLQAVYDPGLGIVIAGFVMLSLGVVFIYYIRPRLLPAAGDSHGA
jgi:hypothetical protein